MVLLLVLLEAGCGRCVPWRGPIPGVGVGVGVGVGRWPGRLRAEGRWWRGVRECVRAWQKRLALCVCVCVAFGCAG